MNRDLDGYIKNSKLKEFLKNDKAIIIKRLSLINLILPGFNLEEK